MTMIRKLMPAQVTALGDDEVEVRISTATLARDGHILVPQGCLLDNYRANPIWLWQHDPEHPIGSAENVQIGTDDITARVRFAPAGISKKADEIRGLVKAGIIRAVSVGFDPIDGEPLDPKKPRGGMRFTSWELLECSFCSVPVDTGAVVTARAQSPSMIRFEESIGMSEKTGLKAKHARALDRAAKAPLFKRGLYEVANLAYMLEQFGYAHACSEWEAEIEGDESPVPAMLGEALVKFGEAFIAMSKEEVTELLAGKDLEIDDEAIVVEERAFVAAAKSPRARAWRQGIAMARAGKALSASNGKKLEDAQGHHDRAMKHSKTLGEHHDAVGGHMDAITAAQEKAQQAQADTGEALDAAKKEPNKADEHLKRAAKANKALGGHLDDATAASSDFKDRHADVGDAHAAIGRSIKSAQRCVRAVVEGSTPGAEDGDTKEVQTSAGTGESEGSKGDRSYDYRRRQSDLLGLAADLA